MDTTETHRHHTGQTSPGRPGHESRLTQTLAREHTSVRAARATLYLIAAIQIGLGAAFLISPTGTARTLGLAAAPAWTSWLFAMMAARFLGYGAGMIAAARHPGRHLLWLQTMILVQAIDWFATVAHLARHDVTLSQVTTAAFLPPLFVVALTVAVRTATRIPGDLPVGVATGIAAAGPGSGSPTDALQ